MRWGRCSLIYRRSPQNHEYKYFQINLELSKAVLDYKLGNATEMEQVKTTDGNTIGYRCVDYIEDFSNLEKM
jgi:predicted transcriptional regulator